MSKALTFLVAYGTGEGQTERIANRIADALGERGHDATAANVEELPPAGSAGTAEASADETADVPSVEDADAVLVGASIHGGKHQPAIREFVRTHRDALAAKPTAFFQVSLSSATDEGAEQAAGYVEAFLEETRWHPDRIGLFGGALRYSEYGFLKRLVMRRIATRAIPDAEELGAVEDSGDVEFTDWHEVEAFAADVAAFVEGRLGVVPPAADGTAGDR